MAEDRVSTQIEALVHEERQLHQRSAQGEGLDDEGRRRLQALRVELDSCTDLLTERPGSDRPGSDRANLAPRASGIRPDSGIGG
jgi:hypothetical protein